MSLWEELKEQHCHAVLRLYLNLAKGNRTKAAEALGIPRESLLKLLRRYNVQESREYRARHPGGGQRCTAATLCDACKRKGVDKVVDV